MSKLKRIAVGIVLAGVLLLPGAARGQGGESASHARRGMAIGGIAGGVLGGLGVGVLAHGLCEYECDHAFQEGFVIGFLGGGVVGGLVGLVVGAGIPRNAESPDPGEPSESWALGAGLGPRWAGASTINGTNVWAGLTALRPTTSRIRWGFQFNYLGRATHADEFETQGREGGTTFFRNEWTRRIWNLALVAERSPEGGLGPYLSANVGAYPIFESLKGVRTTPDPDPTVPEEVSERSTSVFPGVGLGGGGLWSLGGRMALGFDSRLHLILGAGDGSFLPLLSAGFTLRRQGG